MNAGKHTPGPWKFSREHFGKDAHARDRFQTVWTVWAPGARGNMFRADLPDFCGGPEVMEEHAAAVQEVAANVALVCAAPDLLEALEKLAGMVPDIAKALPFGVPTAYADAFDKARAAIAAARGEVSA